MASFRFPPRFIFVVAALAITLLLYSSSSIRSSIQRPSKASLTSWTNIYGSAPLPTVASSHPIDHLIQGAQSTFDEILTRQSTTLAEAASAYRKARGRHPPPGFGDWYKYASENDAIVVEDFWDQIYHDINPYWGLEPVLIRNMAKNVNMVVAIHDGVAKTDTAWFWHEIWTKMISTVSQWVPDMIIPLNSMDEPRLFVPSEQIDALMAVAESRKEIKPKHEVIEKCKGWSPREPKEMEVPEVEWLKTTTYTLARQACAHDSPVRKFPTILEREEVMNWATRGDPHSQLDDIYKGYLNSTFVTNATLEADTCSDAMLGGMHGALIRPITSSSSKQLIPLFGGSKLSVNNEILLPAPMYWNDEERFTGGADVDIPWDQKIPQAVWRGTATGGTNTPTNWNRFHRHRFVAITNGTKARAALAGGHDPFFTDLFRRSAISTLDPKLQEQLPLWLGSNMDVAFTDLMCEEGSGGSASDCWYTSPHYQVEAGIHMSEQFHYKYLPDIDGNSFSGRYRAFLTSTSLPIKATLYREWHDSRLIAWKHFVPMNNRFTDFYRILEYFEGFIGPDNNKVGGHNDMAKKIALDGREWSKKVLRKEDMQIYVFRLLLEYARVTDDEREQLGFVADLS
jgi:hypothetical protein